MKLSSACLWTAGWIVGAMAPAWAAAEPESVIVTGSSALAQAEALRGDYALDNGRSLNVAGSLRQLRVAIDDQASQVLAPVPGGWASADGQLRLEFQMLPNGLVRQLRLIQLPVQRVAQAQ